MINNNNTMSQCGLDRIIWFMDGFVFFFLDNVCWLFVVDFDDD